MAIEDEDRIADRHGEASAPMIVRFQLIDLLGSSTGAPGVVQFANAYIVGYGDSGLYFPYSDSASIIQVFDSSGRFFGLAGEAGWALFHPDSEFYEVISMEGCLIRHGVLNADLAAGGTALARLWYYDVPGAADTDSTVNVNVYDWTRSPRKTGDKIIVYFEPKSNRWYVIGGAGSELIRFELTSVLTLGGVTTAKKVVWDGAAYSTTGADFSIRDFTATPGTWSGESGYRGWCIRVGDRDAGYEIIWMETRARWIEFTLTADMAAGSSAAATVNAWAWGKNPGATVTVYDPQDLFKRALTGAKGEAIWDEKLARYKLVECQSKAGAIRFTLTADMAANSATATATSYWGTQQDIQSPGSTVTVYDDSNLFPRALSGAKGVAIYDGPNDKYRVVECQQQANALLATLNADMVETDATKAVTAVGVMFPAVGQMPSSTSITAYNTFHLMASSGNTVLLLWDEANARWVIDQVPHVAVSTITSWRVDTATMKLQYKKTKVIVAGAYPEDASWTDAHTGTACP